MRSAFGRGGRFSLDAALSISHSSRPGLLLVHRRIYENFGLTLFLMIAIATAYL
jgi:hypothetical protein